MSEAWTYRPADLLMFSPETYYRLFELYNADAWPAQIVALGAGMAIFVLMARGPRWRPLGLQSRGPIFLTAMPASIWQRRISPGFAAQAVLTAISGVFLQRLAFTDPRPLAAKAGIGLFLFALFVQPLIGPFIGRDWSGVEL